MSREQPQNHGFIVPRGFGGPAQPGSTESRFWAPKPRFRCSEGDGGSRARPWILKAPEIGEFHSPGNSSLSGPSKGLKSWNSRDSPVSGASKGLNSEGSTALKSINFTDLDIPRWPGAGPARNNETQVLGAKTWVSLFRLGWGKPGKAGTTKPRF